MDLSTGAVIREFITDTTLRGIAWTGADQLAYFTDSSVAGAGQLLSAIDISTGITRDVAQLAKGSIWKLATLGPSC